MLIREQVPERSAPPRPAEDPRPAVVSLSRRCRLGGSGGESAELVGRLGLILEELAAAVRSGGGFVGHLKAFLVTDDGSSLGLSVTRDRAVARGAGFKPSEPVVDFKLAVTAIVYGCAKTELERLVTLALGVGLPRDYCLPERPETNKPLKMLNLAAAPVAQAPTLNL